MAVTVLRSWRLLRKSLWLPRLEESMRIRHLDARPGAYIIIQHIHHSVPAFSIIH